MFLAKVIVKLTGQMIETKIQYDGALCYIYLVFCFLEERHVLLLMIHFINKMFSLLILIQGLSQK